MSSSPKMIVTPTMSPNELDYRHSDVQGDFRAICQSVGSLGSRMNPDRPQLICRGHAINRSGIHQKQAFPSLVWITGITHRDRYMCGTHAISLTKHWAQRQHSPFSIASYSAAVWAPFSATDRRISSTRKIRNTDRAADAQKMSK